MEHFTTKLKDHYTQHSRQSVRLVENTTTEGLSLALTTGSNSLYINNQGKDSRSKDKAFITICNTERPHYHRISPLDNNSNIVEPLPAKWTTGIWPCTLPSEITPTTEQTTPATNETQNKPLKKYMQLERLANPQWMVRPLNWLNLWNQLKLTHYPPVLKECPVLQ